MRHQSLCGRAAVAYPLEGPGSEEALAVPIPSSEAASGPAAVGRSAAAGPAGRQAAQNRRKWDGVEEVRNTQSNAPSFHLQHALLEFAASQSSAVFYMAELGGENRVRFVTSNIEAITGHKTSAVLEDAGYLSRQIHPDDLPGYRLSLKALQQRGSLIHAYRLRISGGAYRWFQEELRLVESDGGQETMLVGCLLEIRKRESAAERRPEDSDLVRHVLESCPIPITLNRAADGKILYESPAARALLGHGALRDGETVIDRWVVASDREAYLERLRHSGAVDGLEVRYRRADGEEFPCVLSSRLIEYQGQEAIISNLVDLTEHREAESKLARQREILHQSEKLSAMGELLAGVSHELNNPLSVLVGQALMLQEAAPDEETAERAEMIGKAADRCARIVKTFLAMARQEPTEMAPLDLHAIVDGALEVTVYSLRTSNIEVSLNLDRALPLVMADADQMRQVLINLIVNAHHALQGIEGRRELQIASSHNRHREEVVITVRDNGPGIPADIRSRIFEPLYTTKDIGMGTGMGLALCHRIVEGHGGRILAEAAPGGGAAIVIRMPCAKEEEQPAEEIPFGRKDTTHCRVLVIDDEHDVGRIIADVLEHDGHSVELAGSGGMALGLLKHQHYDIILSDVRMPGMDGPSFYRNLGNLRPELIDGLAFITGDTLSPWVKDFLDASERPYLAKPLTPEDLRELVELLMRRRML